MFEHHAQPLLSPWEFVRRQALHTLAAGALVAASLFFGMLGYHFLEGQSWLDAFLNASMILGGMGPVDALKTQGGKLFAGLYALYSGMVFLVVAGVMFAPFIHRLLHKLHLDENEPDAPPEQEE